MINCKKNQTKYKIACPSVKDRQRTGFDKSVLQWRTGKGQAKDRLRTGGQARTGKGQAKDRLRTGGQAKDRLRTGKGQAKDRRTGKGQAKDRRRTG